MFCARRLSPLLQRRQPLTVMARRGVSSAKHSDALLSALEAIAMTKSNRPVKFIDASWYMDPSIDVAAAFKNERIPGAVRFDIDEVKDMSDPLPHMVPTAAEFSVKCQQMGLRADEHFVVYAAPGASSAPRVWWTFKLFGHQNVSVLDGGLAAWKAAGGAIESGEIAPVAKGNLCGVLNKDLIVTLDEVFDIVESGSAQICDARPAGRFDGDVDEPREELWSGHIPGSINIPSSSFVSAEDCTSFKTVDEIRAIVDDAGIISGVKVINTCGSGVTACINALSLYRIGWPLSQIPVYDGSWSEWGDFAYIDLPRVVKRKKKNLVLLKF